MSNWYRFADMNNNELWIRASSVTGAWRILMKFKHFDSREAAEDMYRLEGMNVARNQMPRLKFVRKGIGIRAAPKRALP